MIIVLQTEEIFTTIILRSKTRALYTIQLFFDVFSIKEISGHLYNRTKPPQKKCQAYWKRKSRCSTLL